MQTCRKKYRHASAEAAGRHLARLELANARAGRERPGEVLHVYECPICSAPDAPIWHVGHKRQEPSS